MIATTLFGLEPLLKDELEKINAKKIQIGNRCVYFTGNNELMYRANIQLRTALKILKEISIFKSKNEHELYKNINRIKWDKIMTTSQTFSVTSTVNSKYFSHSNYVSLVTKDAIVDQFRKKYNKRPSVDLKNPDFNIHIHISNNNCNISLNSSGKSLHKRGYRTNRFTAPMNEVLAAGMVLLSGWNKQQNLINPMCGSGTLIIEAGLIAKNRAPNIFRNNFSFQNWNDYDNILFNNLKIDIRNREVEFQNNIVGFDISASAIAMARQSVESIKLNDIIKIQGKNFFKSNGEENSIILINPPYGKRIALKQDYYKQLGDTLKQNYINTDAWIISSELEQLKKIGLKPSKKIKLFNGALECKLVKYELYKGSKKFNKFQSE
ncbi:MAG: RNA methyltransferase [Flavobacteriales bacterium]|nr:RNA methyltransferase [Flavobacteriales bacterium]|tara:strand:- start:9254 stop:10390 length:1137 start_codon:yes stop_codon:yes gene_type:complete